MCQHSTLTKILHRTVESGLGSLQTSSGFVFLFNSPKKKGSIGIPVKKCYSKFHTNIKHAGAFYDYTHFPNCLTFYLTSQCSRCTYHGH